MSPREFVDLLYIPANKDMRKRVVQGSQKIACPLDCGEQVVYLPHLKEGWGELVIGEHKQRHANSVRCYWSGKRLLALQGLVEVA